MHKPRLTPKAWKRRLARKLLSNGRFDQADLFCQGVGVEIGARSNPYPFTRARVLYADIGQDSEISKTMRSYLQDDHAPLKRTVVKTDIVLKPPRFELPEDLCEVLDFVFSDNVLEHVTNPIAALKNQADCLKSNGVIYGVVPNKRYTFDRDRELTEVSAMFEKFEHETFDISLGESEEIARHKLAMSCSELSEAAIQTLARDIRERPDGGPHISVFDECNLNELLELASKICGLSLVYFSAPPHQPIHFCLRKSV
jgi:SAM-dependent methyltransferase